MATIPYSRSGMDPFQQALRKRKKTHAKAHAEAQRRYARTHREQINLRKRYRYMVKKEREERLAWKLIREMEDKAELAARLAEIHRPPPELTLREVWDLDYFERVRNRNRRRGM